MATKPTILKASLQVSDIDRGHYDDFTLTISQQPSETDERVMVRLLAFAIHASEGLQFTEGIAAEGEPDIWLKSLTGDIELWIEVGLPSEKRIRKACNQARKVFVYTYGARNAPAWWESMAEKLERHKNLEVIFLPPAATRSLSELAQKKMTLHCTIQDGQIYMGDAENNLCIEPQLLHGAT